MGNGALAIGPKLPRPSSTLPDRQIAAAQHSGSLLGGEQTKIVHRSNDARVTVFGCRPGTHAAAGTEGRRSKTARERSRGEEGTRLSGRYGELVAAGGAAGGVRVERHR